IQSESSRLQSPVLWRIDWRPVKERQALRVLGHGAPAREPGIVGIDYFIRRARGRSRGWASGTAREGGPSAIPRVAVQRPLRLDHQQQKQRLCELQFAGQ